MAPIQKEGVAVCSFTFFFLPNPEEVGIKEKGGCREQSRPLNLTVARVRPKVRRTEREVKIGFTQAALEFI